MVHEKQGKRGPDRLTSRLLYNAYSLLLSTVTGLPKSALRYQMQKRGLSMSNPSDVILYLQELRGK